MIHKDIFSNFPIRFMCRERRAQFSMPVCEDGAPWESARLEMFRIGVKR